MKKEQLRQEETITEKFRTNPWMVSTFVLIIICTILIIPKFVDTEEKSNIRDQAFLEELCSKVTSIPSWANKKGEIINSGYIPFGNQSKEFIDGLILEEIYFIYHPDCGWCHKQIEDFGEHWQRYLESGLTIDCSNVQ